MRKYKLARNLFATSAALLASSLSTAQPSAAPAGPIATSLETRSYIHRLTLLAHNFAGSDRRGKIQMMIEGDRRYLIQSGDVEVDGRLELQGSIVDVTNPRQPIVVARDVWKGTVQAQVAYHEASKRWLLVNGWIALGLKTEGLRGIEVRDITDPANPKLLSRYSTDGGDPGRRVQTGSGTNRLYYDGGRYAYLAAAPDNNFYHDEKTRSRYYSGLQVIDLSIPEKPTLVSNWHLPGQRADEAEARAEWRSRDDPHAWPESHGPVYVPKRVEDGGTLGYGAWSSFHLLIHDLSDPAAPKLVSRWEPSEYQAGPMFGSHTVDVARLDRGFVISNPQSMALNCQESWNPTTVIDVSDPRQPREIGVFPVPQPPAEAPYRSFCQRYGRFGPHNGPHLKAPGKPDPDFTCYTYMSGGLQCFDISDPRKPRVSAYFVPGQGTEGAKADTPPTMGSRWTRGTETVFIEWDRRLIWVGTDTGLYALAADDLGPPVLEAMAASEWAHHTPTAPRE